MESICTHGFHTRLFGKIIALKDALFLLMQVNQLSNTSACSGCSREPRHKKGDGFLANKRRHSRGAELLYEAKTVAIQGDLGADKERRNDFREQPCIRSVQEVTDFHTKIP